MKKKAWWRSRTLWANLIALVALAAQSQLGYVLSPETQMTILGALNLVLRLITGEAVGFHDEKPGPGEFPGIDAGGPGVAGS